MALSKQIYSFDRGATSLQYKIGRREVWHGYLLSHDERAHLDNMMGRALLDEAFCEQLLYHRDASLLADYGFSTETQRWLCSIEAGSLSELAQAIAQ